MCGESLDGGETLGGDPPAPPPRPRPVIGSRVGPYRVLSLLGEGGMGRVYCAEHRELGDRVALKMLRSRFAGSPEAKSRFFAEARAASQVTHPHVVTIIDSREGADGLNYFVMELLEGETLRDLLAREGPPSIARSLRIGAQVAEGLAAVHAAGIVHRDLKPDNIFLTRHGAGDFVKILDFGVARLVGCKALAGISLQRTAEGAILGTPEYMSPEQASGKAIDHRSDVYALGVVLFELLCGRKPFEPECFGDLLVQQLTRAPPRPRDVRGPGAQLPEAVEELIGACLQVDPGRRVQSMDDLAAQLGRLADAGAAARSRQRHPLVAALAAR
jgi:eukaryotic-like serine/threonine-protein kinase